MMKTKRIALLLGVLMMTLAAQLSTVSAQTKHYKFTFDNLSVSKEIGADAVDVKGKATIDICDKKGGATITVSYGKVKKTYKIGKNVEISGTKDEPIITFNEVKNNIIQFQHTLSLSQFDDLQLSFTRAEDTGGGYEYWPLLEFTQTVTKDSANCKTLAQLLDDIKSGKARALKASIVAN